LVTQNNRTKRMQSRLRCIISGSRAFGGWCRRILLLLWRWVWLSFLRLFSVRETHIGRG
jgi:hypothetical protein